MFMRVRPLRELSCFVAIDPTTYLYNSSQCSNIWTTFSKPSTKPRNGTTITPTPTSQPPPKARPSSQIPISQSNSANLAHTTALLNFNTPRGLRLNLSSLASPNFATSYSLANLGVVDGSLSYLYSSRDLTNVHNSKDVNLHHVVQGYRQLQQLVAPEMKHHWEVWHRGVRIDRRGIDPILLQSIME